MNIVAFAGPSLRAADRSAFAAIDWKPPAEAGDLLRLNLERSSTVCLIDGYFDHRPAVRHKEILLLLSEGIRVFGASSIGALRAAEMDTFGMIGVGAIYRAYARGSIRGDDEVALIHAPSRLDWRPLSVPLVDVRATLCRARRASILDAGEARTMFKAAAGIHYVDRSWPDIIAQSRVSRRANALESWLRTGAVEQKRLDALRCIRAAIEGDPASQRPRLVRTPYLDALARECGVTMPTPDR